jgi:cytochrome c oxidase subunit 4
MADDHKHPKYMMIFFWLLLLTVVEIGASYLPKWLPDTSGIHTISILLLVAFAVVKAALVGFYFMHLKFERWAFIGIVTFPILLMIVLVCMLIPDVTYG